MKLQTSPGSRSRLKAYGSCMTAAGYPAKEWSSTYWRVFDRFRSRDDTRVPWSELRVTAHWRESVAYERAAGAADARCRRPLHAYAMQALRRDVDAFAATHAAQLKLAEQQWARLRSAQRAAGLT